MVYTDLMFFPLREPLSDMVAARPSTRTARPVCLPWNSVTIWIVYTITGASQREGMKEKMVRAHLVGRGHNTGLVSL